MIVLDENVVASQMRLLHEWHVAARKIGVDIGRAGMQDDEVIPFLHNLKRTTFITRDVRFYSRETPHANYCIVVLAVEQHEVAFFARRFLKHPDFNTAQKRMGLIVQAGHQGLRVRRLNAGESSLPWLKLV